MRECKSIVYELRNFLQLGRRWTLVWGLCLLKSRLLTPSLRGGGSGKPLEPLKKKKKIIKGKIMDENKLANIIRSRGEGTRTLVVGPKIKIVLFNRLFFIFFSIAPLLLLWCTGSLAAVFSRSSSRCARANSWKKIIYDNIHYNDLFY